VQLLGTREKTLKYTGEAVDITDDYSNGYQELCTKDASNAIELTVSGIEKDGFLKGRKNSGQLTGLLEIEGLDGITQFNAVLQAVSFGLAYNDVVTYEATFKSTGDYRPVINNPVDFGNLFSFGYTDYYTGVARLPAISAVEVDPASNHNVLIYLTLSQPLYVTGDTVNAQASWGYFKLFHDGVEVQKHGEIYESTPTAGTSHIIDNGTTLLQYFIGNRQQAVEPYTASFTQGLLAYPQAAYPLATLSGLWRLTYYNSAGVALTTKSVVL
jgi:predicted secreted protein